MAVTIAQKETIQKYFREGRRISEISEIMELSRETIRKLKPKQEGPGMPAEFYYRMIDCHQQERENDSSIE